MHLVGIPVFLAGFGLAVFDGGMTLKEQLAREGAAELAKAAMSSGDARRGAIVFYQPQLLCATCHREGETGEGLGPDLAAVGKTAAGADCCRSDSGAFEDDSQRL